MSITIVQNILKEVSSGYHAIILPHLLFRTLVPYDILKVRNPLSTQSCQRSHHPISLSTPYKRELKALASNVQRWTGRASAAGAFVGIVGAMACPRPASRGDPASSLC